MKVLSAKLNQEDNLFYEAHNVHSGTGICLAWRQIGEILKQSGAMRQDEHVSAIRADAHGCSFYFERNEE